MTTRERLHQLIEELSDGSVAAAERMLEDLRADERGEMTSEDRAWMESDLSRLGEHEPYDWGEDGPPTTVHPIRYVPGRGLVVFFDEETPLR
ncbi:MAG: hypothetical protein NTZ05_00385 [Chloroflexi bacterium]|nr:hypothetical protein [Chloroflexota bacterium]